MQFNSVISIDPTESEELTEKKWEVFCNDNPGFQSNFEVVASPNIIPNWYQDHKERQAAALAKKEKSEGEKKQFAKEVDAMLEEYLKAN
ncbi:hypothetical protein GI584_00145 [Gracilibacillus salitolerans]|uniref:Uncharacterized protein n=1 Tax=Gracilibacillus salitolerans TaxID=2663022 RepID=A0A5Q2TCZ6_9BACI|nr:hypothetical protein [Gracilibacillus salitolerans]QGH32589.1 hypothetical protein GI584_00145 [Gracilibacillus salitolerans]